MGGGGGGVPPVSVGADRGAVSCALPPGYSGGCVTAGSVGGGGVVGGVRAGRLAAVKVATVELITVSLALSSPPLTVGRPVGERPPMAAARIAALMTPELTTLPVAVAKLFVPTLTVCVPLV